jgi:MerR family transcriptional regulator, light-induced transcriptional regulator
VNDTGLLRIGELSRRSGVSAPLLRAWERRYGLLQPARSPGGLRLYSRDDLRRVQAMQHYLAAGLAAAEAAALARDAPGGDLERPTLPPAHVRDELQAALDAYDEPRAQAALDRLFASSTLDAALSDVLLPYLRDLGERWASGDVSVAGEHFASTVVRGRLLGLARGWGRGVGPLALLACVPGEQHDLALIAFGLALRAHGWRIVYLGTDTPLETLDRTAQSLDPALIVLSATTADGVRRIATQLRELSTRYPVAIGGPGALAADETANLDVLKLPGDPVAEAAHLTSHLNTRRVAPSRETPY